MKALSVGLPGREKSSVPPHKGPELARDELGAFVQTYGLRIADLSRDAFKRFDNVGAFIGKAHIDRRREPREGVDDREYTDLLPVKELVVDEVHCPDLVGPSRL